MLGLEDAFSIGNKFTWSNGFLWAKLDRVIHNSNWNSLNFNCLVDFMQFNTMSDHNPIMANLSAQTTTKDKPFKFFNMWMTHPDFMNTASLSWHSPVFGAKKYLLCMKLKDLKPKLKTLNMQHFSHISERAKRAQETFVEAQNMLLNDPNSSLFKARVKESRKMANFLLEAERKFFQ